MIYDKTSNIHLVLPQEVLKPVYEYLSGLTSTTPDCKTEIKGTKIFASLFTNKTGSPADSVIEAHKKFVDVH